MRHAVWHGDELLWRHLASTVHMATNDSLKPVKASKEDAVSAAAVSLAPGSAPPASVSKVKASIKAKIAKTRATARRRLRTRSWLEG